MAATTYASLLIEHAKKRNFSALSERLASHPSDASIVDDESKNTALHILCFYKKPPIDLVVRLCTACPETLSLKNSDGWTPRAVANIFSSSALQNCLTNVEGNMKKDEENMVAEASAPSNVVLSQRIGTLETKVEKLHNDVKTCKKTTTASEKKIQKQKDVVGIVANFTRELKSLTKRCNDLDKKLSSMEAKEKSFVEKQTGLDKIIKDLEKRECRMEKRELEYIKKKEELESKMKGVEKKGKTIMIMEQKTKKEFWKQHHQAQANKSVTKTASSQKKTASPLTKSKASHKSKALSKETAQKGAEVTTTSIGDENSTTSTSNSNNTKKRTKSAIKTDNYEPITHSDPEKVQSEEIDSSNNDTFKKQKIGNEGESNESTKNIDNTSYPRTRNLERTETAAKQEKAVIEAIEAEETAKETEETIIETKNIAAELSTEKTERLEVKSDEEEKRVASL